MSNPRGFGALPPRIWTFRLRDEEGPIASFDIAPTAGRPMSKRQASTVVALIVSLLQEPFNPGNRLRLLTVLPYWNVLALVRLSRELDTVFWVDAINPAGRRVGQGHSQASGSRGSVKREGGRNVNPEKLVRV